MNNIIIKLRNGEYGLFYTIIVAGIIASAIFMSVGGAINGLMLVQVHEQKMTMLMQHNILWIMQGIGVIYTYVWFKGVVSAYKGFRGKRWVSLLTIVVGLAVLVVMMTLINSTTGRVF